MDYQGNRVLKLAEYIRTFGVEVNLGKNKARGNKGVFFNKKDTYRIDISNKLDKDSQLSTLLHEFAHFIHFKYDKTITSLDFVFSSLSLEEQRELLEITVQNVPKKVAVFLYNEKSKYAIKNREIVTLIKEKYPEFALSKPLKEIEDSFKTPEKYFLKYDKFKLFNKIYSIDNLNEKEGKFSKEQVAYLQYLSNKRKISRINSKINRLNKYYNQPSELWARFFELYFSDRKETEKIAPILSSKFRDVIGENKIPELTKFYKFYNA